MTRAFWFGGVQVTVTRTAERVTALSPDKTEIVTRNIWSGDNGKKYVQYKGEFHWVIKSDCYTQDYLM